MEIRQLRYFVEICKTGSFAQAAENCYITAQGISVSLRKLEEELGAKLLKRSNQGVSPTKAGVILLSRAVLILNEVDACMSYFNERSEGSSSVSVMFTVGSIVEFASLPISHYLVENSDSKLAIEEGSDVDCANAVENGEVEFALCVGPIDHERFDAELLFSAPYGLLVAKNNKLSKKKSVQISDLKDQPLALLRKTSNTTQCLFDLCHDEGFEPLVDVFIHDFRLGATLAGLNQCCAVMSQPVAERLNTPGLKFLPFDSSLLKWDLYLVKSKDVKLSAGARKFEEKLIEHSMNLNQF